MQLQRTVTNIVRPQHFQLPDSVVLLEAFLPSQCLKFSLPLYHQICYFTDMPCYDMLSCLKCMCRHTLFYCIQALLHFANIHSEGVWQPCPERVCQHHFSNDICSLHVSVYHFGNSHSYLYFFIICIFVILDITAERLQLTEGSDDGQHVLAVKYHCC